MLKKCKSKWCFNFFVKEGRERSCCTKDCATQYSNYKRGLHYWYRLENPKKCMVDNCTNNINPKARRYCDDHCNYITAIKKGFQTQVKNQEQYCKVCDRVFYKERWGKYCSDVCFRIFKNSKLRNMYKEINDKNKLNNEYKYFYLMENEKFYKYGISNNIQQRVKEHEAQGLKLIFFTKGNGAKIVHYESLIKTFTYENNLRFEGNYHWKNSGHTETICKSKLKQPEVKWLVNTIMDKRKVSI